MIGAGVVFLSTSLASKNFYYDPQTYPKSGGVPTFRVDGVYVCFIFRLPYSFVPQCLSIRYHTMNTSP